jgi:phosphonopyruvate decarboxylase
VLNNNSHESVGGQPTAHPGADLAGIALACGYSVAVSATTDGEIEKFLTGAYGPAFLNLYVQAGSRPDLSRPTHTPAQNKQNLVNFLQG